MQWNEHSETRRPINHTTLSSIIRLACAACFFLFLYYYYILTAPSMGYFIYYLFLNPSERRRWLIYINIVCARGMRRKRKYRLIGLIYRLLFTCWSWWFDFLFFFIFIIIFMFQRHRSAPLLTSRSGRYPPLPPHLIIAKPIQRHILTIDLSVVCIIIIVWVRGCYPKSDRQSFLYLVAHARAVIYEKIGAITIYIYIVRIRWVIYYPGRGDIRHYMY